jgi:hypothetical protein
MTDGKFMKFMRGLFVFLVLGLLCMPASVHAETTAFFRSMNDIPIMPGLNEIANDDIVFDKPEGRIAEATATTARSRNAVLSFYNSALPQLGWDRADAGIFTRAGETLNIVVEESADGRLVRILISPGS